MLEGPSAGLPAGVGAMLAGLAGFLALVVMDALRHRAIREHVSAIPRRVPAWAMVVQAALLAVAARFPEPWEAGESLRWALGKMAQAAVLAGSVWGGLSCCPVGSGRQR